MAEKDVPSRNPFQRAIFSLNNIRGREWSENQLAFLLNAPGSLILFLIIAYPLAYAFYIAFHKVGMQEMRTGDMPFVAFNNFLTLVKDKVFWGTLKHTMIFTLISVPLMLIVGLIIALILDYDDVLVCRIARPLVLLPWAVPPIVNGLMWSFIYSSQYGYLNVILYRLGLIDEFIRFLGNADIALYAVILPYVWRVVPFSALLYGAALRTIPNELYEAAMIDGAGAWQQFKTITLPLLRPTTTVLLILRTAFSIMVFEEIFAMTQGGPGDATWVAAWYTYSYAFRYFDFGIGASSAWVLTLIIGVAAMLYIRLIYREIEY